MACHQVDAYSFIYFYKLRQLFRVSIVSLRGLLGSEEYYTFVSTPGTPQKETI
jgi:hypothetical protein